MRGKFCLSLPFGRQASLPTAPIRAGPCLPPCYQARLCHSPLPSRGWGEVGGSILDAGMAEGIGWCSNPR